MKTTIKTVLKTVRKIVLKTQGVIWVKIKYSYFKRMSFIKVTDPKKREELIKDFIETRKRIKDNFVARKVGETEYQTGLTKLFKPITETQKATAKEITDAQKATAEKFASELLPIKEGIEGLPLKLFNQMFPALKYTKSDISRLGALAVNALIKALTKDGVDQTYGIYSKNGMFYMGNKPLFIENNDIRVDDITYEGTPGFWELITSKNPNPDNYTEEDKEKYQRLIIQTNTAYQSNNPKNPNDPSKPNKKGKYSKSNKWKNIIKPIWEAIKQQNEKEEEFEEETDEDDPQPSTSGTGLTILPSDPNALINRFDLLFSSKKAGHTGVRNEIISILDELKRQGVININTYKKLNHLIKK